MKACGNCIYYKICKDNKRFVGLGYLSKSEVHCDDWKKDKQAMIQKRMKARNRP